MCLQATRNRELEQQLAEARESAKQLQLRIDDKDKALKRIEQEVHMHTINRIRSESHAVKQYTFTIVHVSLLNLVLSQGCSLDES